MFLGGTLSLWGQISVTRSDSLLYEGKLIEQFTLVNANGMSVKVTNFAASLTDVCVQDQWGNFDHVVLGMDSLGAYLGRNPKLGATVGRYANRIRNAQFTLDGHTYILEKNAKLHSIHGGNKGFNRQVFSTDTTYVANDTAIVVFTYRSPDQEGGFPGNLDFSIAYKLTNHNELILDYCAVTDCPTVVNFTNHSYFNLSGCKQSVLEHRYQIHADAITPIDSVGIPTGEYLPVTGTIYDFTLPQSAKERIALMGKGYDINYKLNKYATDSLEWVATVEDPATGRVLKAYTTEPGMQFYISSASMDYLSGHEGKKYGRYYGFCLEMQHFPDSPNHPHFPSTVLRQGKIYRQTTMYRFETF